MLTIKAGKLLDGTGGEWDDMTIVVKGERIAEVGPTAEVEMPEETEVIDASDKTVMPGMVESHVHVIASGEIEDRSLPLGVKAVKESIGTVALKSYAHARRDLEAGYTTLRDLGGRDYVDVALRDAINEGWLVGPRMHVAGEALAATGGQWDMTEGLAPHVDVGNPRNIVDSPDEGRKAARYQMKMGADVIKIDVTLTQHVRGRGAMYSQELTFETMQAICEVAHWAKRKVSGHCHGGDGVRDAILAGVDTLEHGRFLTDELLEMMVEHDVYFVPTMTPEGKVKEYGKQASLMTDEHWEWFMKSYDAMYNSVERAHEIGVKIAAGNDSGSFFARHGENAYELEMLVSAGLTPMEAILATTKTGAELMGLQEEIGTVEAGKLADLLVVDGNPLADIKILQDLSRIKKVIKGGEVVVTRA